MRLPILAILPNTLHLQAIFQQLYIVDTQSSNAIDNVKTKIQALASILVDHHAYRSHVNPSMTIRKLPYTTRYHRQCQDEDRR